MNSIEWLDEALDNFGEDDYLLIDCPGQIELYSHLPVMRTLASHLQKKGFKAVGVYLMDALFVTDHAKMLAGNLAALSAMVAMELPHVNVSLPTGMRQLARVANLCPRCHTPSYAQVLTKCDLVQQDLSAYLLPSGQELAASLSAHTPPKFQGLNTAFGRLVCACVLHCVSFASTQPCLQLDDYNMVSFVPLDPTDEDSIGYALSLVDHSIQYGEDLEPKEPQDGVDEEAVDAAAASMAEMGGGGGVGLAMG